MWKIVCIHIYFITHGNYHVNFCFNDDNDDDDVDSWYDDDGDHNNNNNYYCRF